MEIQLRFAKPKDSARMASIRQQARQVAFGAFVEASVCAPVNEQLIAELEQALRQPRHSRGTLVLWFNGQIIGWCQFGPADDEMLKQKGFAQIDCLYIDPAHQRQGMGGALMWEALEVIEAAGHVGAIQWVPEASKSAACFLEAMEFEHMQNTFRLTPDLQVDEICYQLEFEDLEAVADNDI